MITLLRSTLVQIFISFHSAGLLPILFRGYTVFFLGHAPSRTHCNIVDPYIIRHNKQKYDVFSPKDCPFGVSTILEFIWG